MKRYIVYIEPEAGRDLQKIYDFIARNDSSVKAERFIRRLQHAINGLSYMPERFRKSFYIEEEGVHDMVIRGYTICYYVGEESVHILTVFRQK